MKMNLMKLNGVNALFEDNPSLIQVVLDYDFTKVNTEYGQNIRELYIECNCTEGNVYDEEILVGTNRVDVMACGKCGCWSMNVMY